MELSLLRHKEGVRPAGPHSNLDTAEEQEILYENDSNENDCVRGRDGGGAKRCSAARGDHAGGPVQGGRNAVGQVRRPGAGYGRGIWKPGEGVRSVGDVFNLIVTENRLLAGTLAGAGGGRGGGSGAQVIEPEKLQEALKTSYANVQKAIEGLSDADLKAPVKMFGKDITKEDAVRFIFGDRRGAPRPVDRLCAHQRCRTAMVEVRETLTSRGFDDHVIAGHAVRTASALEESGFYDCSGAFPGFWRGREHGDF